MAEHGGASLHCCGSQGWEGYVHAPAHARVLLSGCASKDTVKLGQFKGRRGGGKAGGGPQCQASLGRACWRGHTVTQFRVGALPTSSPRPPCRTHGRSELQQAETHALSCTHQHLHARGMQAAGTQLARTRVPALECQARVQRRPPHVLSAHARAKLSGAAARPPCTSPPQPGLWKRPHNHHTHLVQTADALMRQRFRQHIHHAAVLARRAPHALRLQPRAYERQRVGHYLHGGGARGVHEVVREGVWHPFPVRSPARLLRLHAMP